MLGSNSTAGANTRAPSALLMAAHIAYAAALHGSLVLLWMWPLQALAAYLTAYCLVPPRLAAAAFNALGVPELVQAVFGGLLDAYRRDSNISFAAPGQPGCFDGHAGGKGSGKALTAPYIFACHPTGIRMSAGVSVYMQLQLGSVPREAGCCFTRVFCFSDVAATE
jgi:hypothetical protein